MMNDGDIPPLTLVLGGARSGKSAFAEIQALKAARQAERRNAGRCVYLATAEPGDGEMAARIDTHKRRRGAGWQTVEEPIEICAQLRRHCTRAAAILLDCVTLWLANLFAAGRDVTASIDCLGDTLTEIASAQTNANIILVSNEIGLGLVPDTQLGRRFRDAQGLVNQSLAARCDAVIFVAAGLPLYLKSAPGAAAPR